MIGPLLFVAGAIAAVKGGESGSDETTIVGWCLMGVGVIAFLSGA